VRWRPQLRAEQQIVVRRVYDGIHDHFRNIALLDENALAKRLLSATRRRFSQESAARKRRLISREQKSCNDT